MDDRPGQGAGRDSPGPGPKIIRPIPRRPFKFGLSTPTPPEEDDEYNRSPKPQITASDLRFLDPHQHAAAATPHSRESNNNGSTPLSHTTSYLNLTSPTLYGIYSPSTTSPPGGRYDDDDENDYFPDRSGGGGGVPHAAANPPLAVNVDDDDGEDTEDHVIPRPGLDEATYQLMRRRRASHSHSSASHPSLLRRGTSSSSSVGPSLFARERAQAEKAHAQVREVKEALQLALRAGLLFVLGAGYGVLVTRLPRGNNNINGDGYGTGQGGAEWAQYEWRYLALWGAAGVALGSLLPWFDRVWEEKFGVVDGGGGGGGGGGGRRKEGRVGLAGRGNGVSAMRGAGLLPSPSSTQEEEDDEADDESARLSSPSQPHPSQQHHQQKQPPSDNETDNNPLDKQTAAAADWALVVRGIGAFVGIAFALRRLPWASTMQVSLTLALANPFLWYLIDRSKPGFLLSAAVGLAGSAAVMLMGLDLGAVLAPVVVAGAGGGVGGGGYGMGVSSAVNGSSGVGIGGGSGGRGAGVAATSSLETIETGIWLLSVLFCSCVCFGNIGRRLALNSSAAGRGRWGGVR